MSKMTLREAKKIIDCIYEDTPYNCCDVAAAIKVVHPDLYEGV